jgi:hypothetical protein
MVFVNVMADAPVSARRGRSLVNSNYRRLSMVFERNRRGRKHKRK